MKALYKKELRSYFSNMIGPIFIAYICFWLGLFSMVLNFRNGYPNYEYVISNAAFVSFLAIPILTMRSFSEERNKKTDQLLYTLPMSMSSIVWAKFLSMLTILAIPTILSCLVPLILSVYMTVPFGTCYAAIAGFFLLGATLIAIGMFISSTTQNQVIAAVMLEAVILVVYFITSLKAYLPSENYENALIFTLVAVLLALIVYSVTKNTLASVITGAVLVVAIWVIYIISPSIYSGAFSSIIGSIALFDELDVFIGGIFDLTAVILFLSIQGLFFFFTVQSLEKRRWN